MTDVRPEDGNGRRPVKRHDERTVPGGHRRMRRADREVCDPAQIRAIIERCDVVHVSYVDAEGLTIVPMNFGFAFDDDTAHLTLYMHSAPEGRKFDAINAAGNALEVAFEMNTDREVIEGRTWCNWGEAFKSVIGNGVASIVRDVDEQIRGLQLLMQQQMGVADIPFTPQQAASVMVWKIEAGRISAKIHEKPQAHHHHPNHPNQTDRTDR